MKFLILGNLNFNGDGIGGVETTVGAIHKHLVDSGHHVLVVHGVMDNRKFVKNDPDIDYIHLRNSNGFKRLWPVPYIKNDIAGIVDKYKPDFIWSRSFVLALAAADSASRPIAVIYPTLSHMVYLWDFKMKPFLFWPWKKSIFEWLSWSIKKGWRFFRYFIDRYFESKALRKFRSVVFSRNMKEQMQRAYKTPNASVHLVHPGVRSDIFNPVNGKKLFVEINKKYSLVKKDNFVLFVGCLALHKNISLLLDAMGFLKNPNRLVVVGDGPGRAKFEHYARQTGLAGRILFVGKQDRLLPGFYSMARVLVNPALIEPFGNVLIESLACGTPVIGIKSDGVRTMTALDEITGGGKYGRMVEPSPEALAKSIDEIIDLRDNEYNRMTKRGVQFVLKNYRWPEFIKKTTEISRHGI